MDLSRAEDIFAFMNKMKEKDIQKPKENIIQSIYKRGNVMSKKDIERIDSLISKFPNYEIELSIGNFNNGKYFSNISSKDFVSLKNYLSNIYKNYIFLEEKVELDGNVRKITSQGKTYFQIKNRLFQHKIDNEEYGWRVNVSEELDIKEPDNFNSKFTRNKKRYSFIPKKGNEWFGVSIDLTIVNGNKYEVEIEKNNKNVKGILFNNILIQLLKVINNTNNIDYIITQKQKNFVKGMNILRILYFNKPINIKYNSLLKMKDYSATIKLDGERKIIIFTNRGVFAINPFTRPFDVYYISDYKGMNDTLIDCEYISTNNKYYIFDVLFYNGNDLRDSDLITRLKYISPILKEKVNNIKLIEKEYYYGELYDILNKVMDLTNNGEKDGTDGIILQPIFQKYMNNKTYKWKPSSKMTIDFMVKNGKLYSKDEFKGNDIYPFNTEYKLNEKYNNKVVEILFKKEGDKYIPIVHKTREDRTFPNAEKVVNDVWCDINDPIEPSTIRGKDLRVVRKYHNIFKRNALSNNLKEGDTIIDWGSGRGGDINKWERLKLKKIYAVEPNDENRTEFERRLLQKKNIKNIEIIPTGAEDFKKEGVDAITTFFSLTFFPRDDILYNGMIDSIDRSVKIGGKVIGAVMDGDRTDKLIGEKEYKNDAFSLTRKNKDTIYISINDKNSMVKNQEEWLFFFERFKSRLNAIGFELENTGFINTGDFERLNDDSKVFSNLFRHFTFIRKYKSYISKIINEKNIKSTEEEFIKEVLKNTNMKLFDQVNDGALKKAIMETYNITSRQSLFKLKKMLKEGIDECIGDAFFEEYFKHF